jgi:hypothetical protein
MIQPDNKLARTRKEGYNPIIKKEKKTEEKKKDLFSYDDYDHDDFFFGETKMNHKSTNEESERDTSNLY